MTDALLLMVGLPESGKSTFLGALFHMLQGAGTEGLRLVELPEEREYLIELEQDWLSLQPLQRSRHHGPKGVELQISLDERPVRLQIPDVVGEDHKQAWEHGGWEAEVAAHLRAAGGLMLFIRSDAVAPAELIGEAAVAEGGVPMGSRLEDAEATTDGAPSAWDPEESPTQAILCDLLEQLDDLREGSLPSLAVVISAWDAAAGAKLPPDAWLAWKMPLLDQWLRAREPSLDYDVFGISAQGGDLRDESVRQQVAQRVEDRPIPLHGHHMTAPVRWLLGRSRE